MDKEQILALAEKCGIFPRLTPDGTDEVWSTKRDVESFFDAAIESYKAELLKEVGEPIYQVCKSDSISLSSAWIDVTEQTYNDAGLYPEYGRRILYTSDQVAAAILKATGPLEKEIERLKGTKDVQLDIHSNNARTNQQRELDGPLEMGQLLADSKNEETGDPKAERTKSLVWMHTGGGHIADSSGKRIGIFSGDFKHRDRLICAVNSESYLLAQLAAAQEEIERYKASPTVETCRQMIESQAVKENKILFDQLAKAEQRVAEACKSMCLRLVRKENEHAAGYGIGYLNYSAQDVADFIYNGEWRKFVKEV